MRQSLPLALFACTIAAAQCAGANKVFMITDLEGVDGIFDFDLQCNPYHSPRYQESRKLLTDEVDAAVDGLLEGGATEIVVYDGHAGGQNLSTLDIHPEARLLAGQPVSSTLELDRSYQALVFIGLHAMAGARNAILPHSYSWEVQNIWVNGRRTGEIGGRTLLAGYYGIPAIMLSGDTAACQELHELVSAADCAEVKSGVGGAGGFPLSHSAARALIREKARHAMEHLRELKPYKIAGPVEVKVEFTTRGTRSFSIRPGVEQLDDRTWLFRGGDIMDAWLKYSSF
jgi:D-amino peptidase